MELTMVKVHYKTKSSDHTFKIGYLISIYPIGTNTKAIISTPEGVPVIIDSRDFQTCLRFEIPKESSEIQNL